jgi:hypothetical protein
LEHVAAVLADLPASQRDRLAHWATPDGMIFLVITGPHGTGKSYAGAALLKHIGAGVFASMPELLQLQRHLPFEDVDGKPTKGALVLTLKTCPILVIDELGSSSGGVDETQLLDDVLGFRKDRRLKTVLISNVDPDQLAAYLGARIMDRVLASVLNLPLVGRSRRGKGEPSGLPGPLRVFSGVLPEGSIAFRPRQFPGWSTWLSQAYPEERWPQFHLAPSYAQTEFLAWKKHGGPIEPMRRASGRLTLLLSGIGSADLRNAGALSIRENQELLCSAVCGK